MAPSVAGWLIQVQVKVQVYWHFHMQDILTGKQHIVPHGPQCDISPFYTEIVLYHY